LIVRIPSLFATEQGKVPCTDKPDDQKKGRLWFRAHGYFLFLFFWLAANIPKPFIVPSDVFTAPSSPGQGGGKIFGKMW